MDLMRKHTKTPAYYTSGVTDGAAGVSQSYKKSIQNNFCMKKKIRTMFFNTTTTENMSVVDEGEDFFKKKNEPHVDREGSLLRPKFIIIARLVGCNEVQIQI